MADDDTPPDATPQVLVNLPEDLLIPEPFAFAGSNSKAQRNATLLQRNDKAGIGSFLYAQCDCGQPFRCDLLSKDLAICPNCKTRYAHFVVLAADDDPDVVWEAYRHLLEVNGHEPDGADDDGDD